MYIRANFGGPPIFFSGSDTTWGLGRSKDIKLAYQYSGKTGNQKQNEDMA